MDYYFKYQWRGKMLRSYYTYTSLARCRDWALGLLDASRRVVEIYAAPPFKADILLEVHTFSKS